MRKEATMKQNRENLKAISLRIPVEIWQKLGRLAIDKVICKQELIAGILMEYLNKHENKDTIYNEYLNKINLRDCKEKPPQE